VKFGSSGADVFGRNETRRAISTVLAMASGQSANRRCMSVLAGESVLGRQPAAVVLRYEATFRNGEQRIMRLIVLARREEVLVGGNQWQVVV
jgi:hypothetical protein